MKRHFFILAAVLFLSGCSGHQGNELPTEEESGGTEGTVEYSLEGMTEPEETAVEQDTKTETRPWQAVTQPPTSPTGETEPCVIPGLRVTEAEGYTYEYMTKNKEMTPFKAWKDSGEGSGESFTMTRRLANNREYSELKKAEQLYEWHLGLLDGVFVEYIDRGEGMGITLYYYGTRQPTGWSEFETHITEYGYLAIFGMEKCFYIYEMFFPVNMPLEDVKEFLEGIEVEPILFE